MFDFFCIRWCAGTGLWSAEPGDWVDFGEEK